MIPYILLFALPVGIIWIQVHGYERKIGNHSIWVIMYFIVLFAFYAMRDNIGFDYPTYCELIQTRKYEWYIKDRWEYFSYLLLHIAHIFSNPQLFFIGVAAISLPLFYSTIHRYSMDTKEMMISVMVFLAMPIGFLYSLSLSRAFVALAIMFYATKYMLNRNFIAYVICALIASCFHMAAIMYILFYFAALCRELKYFIFMGISVVVGINVGKDFIAMIFPVFAKYLFHNINSNAGGYTQIILYLLIGFFLVGGSLYIQYERERYIVLMKCYLMGVIVCLALVSTDPIIAIRSGMLGTMYALLCIPCIIRRFNMTVYGRFLNIVMVIVLFSLYAYGLMITDYGTYIPYRMIGI